MSDVDKWKRLSAMAQAIADLEDRLLRMKQEFFRVASDYPEPHPVLGEWHKSPPTTLTPIPGAPYLTAREHDVLKDISTGAPVARYRKAFLQVRNRLMKRIGAITPEEIIPRAIKLGLIQAPSSPKHDQLSNSDAGLIQEAARNNQPHPFPESLEAEVHKP